SAEAPEFDLTSEPASPSTDPDGDVTGVVESGTPAPAEPAGEEETPDLAEPTLAVALTLAAPIATDPVPVALPVRAVESHTPDLTLPGEPATQSALVAALEERVRRLEDALAQLQNTGGLEERITQQVTARLESQVGPRSPNTAELLLDAGKKLL